MPFATVATKDVASESALRPQKTRTRLSDPARWLLLVDSALLLSRRRGLAANRTAAAFALHRGLLARPAAAGFCSACCDRRVLGEGFCKLFFFSRRPQWGAIRPGAEGVGRWGAARGARMLWKGSGLVVAGCRAPRAQALLLLPPPSPPPALAALLPPPPETSVSRSQSLPRP